jgi:hypothetical protein
MGAGQSDCPLIMSRSATSSIANATKTTLLIMGLVLIGWVEMVIAVTFYL